MSEQLVNEDLLGLAVLVIAALLSRGVKQTGENEMLSPLKSIMLAVSRRAATAAGTALATYGLIATDDVTSVTAALVVVAGVAVDVVHSWLASRWGFK